MMAEFRDFTKCLLSAKFSYTQAKVFIKSSLRRKKNQFSFPVKDLFVIQETHTDNPSCTVIQAFDYFQMERAKDILSSLLH